MATLRPAFTSWLDRVALEYCDLSDQERNMALDSLIAVSGSSQLLMLSSLLPNLVYRDFIRDLPLEVILHIVQYLKGEQLLICCQVSKSWNEQISSLSNLWRSLAENAGVNIPHYSLLACVGKKASQEKAYNNHWSHGAPVGLSYKRLYRHALRLLRGLEHGTSIDIKEDFIHKSTWRITSVRYFRNCIITGCDDHKVQMWSVPEGSVLYTVATNSVCCLLLTEHHLYTASFNANAESWDLYRGRHARTFVGHTSAVLAIDVTADETFLLTGSVDKTAKLWDLRTSEYPLLKTFDSVHEDWVFHVKFVSRGEDLLLMVTCDANTVCLWKVGLGGELFSCTSVSVEGSAKFTSFYHHPDDICHMFACQCTEWTKTSSFFEYRIETKSVSISQIQGFPIPLVGTKAYLLGAGLRFAVIMCSILRKDFHLLDVQKQSVIGTIETPNFYILTRNGSTVTLCDTKWLDGFCFSQMQSDVPVFAAWMAADRVMLGTWAKHVSQIL